MEDDKIEQALEKAVSKKTKKVKKTKGKKSNIKLWEELNVKNLKELGYIK